MVTAEKSRRASLPHCEHVADFGAIPNRRVISNAPSRSHRYSYVGIVFLIFQPNVEAGKTTRPEAKTFRHSRRLDNCNDRVTCDFAESHERVNTLDPNG